MLEEIPPEAKGGAIAGLLLLGLAVVRKLGLKASEDLITLKGDAAERNAIDLMQARMNMMDERIVSLEATRNRMYGFLARCMAFVSRCKCEDERTVMERKILEAEYLELLKDSAK